MLERENQRPRTPYSPTPVGNCPPKDSKNAQQTNAPSTPETGAPGTPETGVPGTPEVRVPGPPAIRSPLKRAAHPDKSGASGTPETGLPGTPEMGAPGTPEMSVPGTPETSATDHEAVPKMTSACRPGIETQTRQEVKPPSWHMDTTHPMQSEGATASTWTARVQAAHVRAAR